MPGCLWQVLCTGQSPTHYRPSPTPTPPSLPPRSTRFVCWWLAHRLVDLAHLLFVHNLRGTPFLPLW